MPSFAIATALGASYLELDVRATCDGTVVVLHDADLQRTTNGAGAVASHTWDEVTALDAGYHFTSDGHSFPYRGQGVRVPTLESVLRAFPEHRFNIEIKQEQPPIVDRVVDVIERTERAARVLLAAEQDPIMRSIRSKVAGRIATGIATGEVVEFVDRLTRNDWREYTPPGQALQVPPTFAGVELITPASVQAAHRLGIEIHAWTINDSAEIERLLDLGVDAIVSDLPGLVVEAVAGRKRWSSER